MNKRIKELLEKAYDQAVPETWANLSSQQLERIHDKFAELIVRECADMCYKASQESFRLNEVKAGAMGMALKVLMEEHFGVEEDDQEDDDSACPLCGEDGGTSCGMPNCQY
jgi:hypothetical protein